MSVTNLMHTPTDFPTEPQTAPVDPDAIWSNQCPPTCEFPNYKTEPCDAHAVNKPCSWKNCTSPSYATIQDRERYPPLLPSPQRQLPPLATQ